MNIDFIGLNCLFGVEQDRFLVDSLILTNIHMSGSTRVCICVKFEKRRGELCLVITNVVTLPYDSRGKGYGKKSVIKLLDWAKKNNISRIEAVQVQEESEGFWKKLDFKGVGNTTNDFVFVGILNE